MPANQEERRYPRIKKATTTQKTQRLSPIGKIRIALQTRKLINQIRTMQIKSSWRTSLFGVGGLATILFNLASMLLDEDPATNPDWSVMLPAIITAAALLFTKDAKVSHAAHPMKEAEPVK